MKNIYKVVWDPERRRVDSSATKERRALEYQAELDAPAVAAKAEEQGAENGTKF